MAWSIPRTWVSGEVLTAANFNTYLSDDLSFLGTHTHTGSAGNGSATVSATTFDGASPSFSSNPIMTVGVRIGVNATDNEIDDATQGGASATLYIGNASINVTSDRRLKRNIQKWAGDGRDLVRQLARDVIEYDQTRERPLGHVRHYVGIAAQDVYRVAPWAVNTQGGAKCAACLQARRCRKHKPWQIKYELLVPVLIKAIAEGGSNA